MKPLRLMAVLAHPDDESLGMGATLVKYASEGIETSLVVATRGEKGWQGPQEQNPGAAALGAIREKELRQAARELGINSVNFLDFIDGELAYASTDLAHQRIVRLLRSIRPQVVVTFGPEGDYGHPDHIAICQLTSGALVCAANPAWMPQAGPAHQVDKFYYMVNSPQLADILIKNQVPIGIEVNGVQRSMVPWPDWAITTRVNLQGRWMEAKKAILQHQSQLPSLGPVEEMSDEFWSAVILAENAYFRVFSSVPTDVALETDLFQGLRES